MSDQKQKRMIGIPENNLPPQVSVTRKVMKSVDITPEQAAADWQAGHDQDFPAVFEAEDRARAKAYAHEHGLALTQEYISRLERIARAAYQAWCNTPNNEQAKELKEALATLDFLGLNV